MSREICTDVFDGEYAVAHDAAMDYRTTIRRIMDRLDLDQDGIADLLGVSQPTISRWLKGVEPTLENHEKIRAKATQLGIINSHDGILEGAAESGTTEAEPWGTYVPIVGYVGAGAVAHYYSEGQGPFGKAKMPPKGTPDLVAVVVRGDSMSPVAEDESIIYYRDRREPPTEDLFGKLCICGLADGRVLLKKLRPSRANPALFDLYSSNGETMPNQEVTWAAKVQFVAFP